MKKKIILVILISFISSLGYSQGNDRGPYSKFQCLISLKRDYERLQYLSRNYPLDSITLIANFTYERYKAQVAEIKKNPGIYLKYIREELKYKDTSNLNLRVLYKFLNFSDPSVMNYKTPYHYIRKRDFFKVIKYSLFDKDEDLLPEDFFELPVIDIDDYNGYNELKPNELRDAVRFILKKIPLNEKETTFVKSKQNPKAVVAIKVYLNKNGLNQESKDFIKWAINMLVTDVEAKLSLGILEMNYIAIKSSDSIPRDKEPVN